MTNAYRERLAREGHPCQLIFVTPDYYEERPKPCMSGWGSIFLTVTPDGTALPCHGARQLPIAFPNVREHSLSHIWYDSPGFNHFRGDDWMPEPCRSCDEKATDFGGCRCQAFMLTGDAAATDPVCAKSPRHDLILAARAEAEMATRRIDDSRKPVTIAFTGCSGLTSADLVFGSAADADADVATTFKNKAVTAAPHTAVWLGHTSCTQPSNDVAPGAKRSYTVSGGSLSVPLCAAYYKKSTGPVTAGDVKATFNVSITYH